VGPHPPPPPTTPPPPRPPPGPPPGGGGPAPVSGWVARGIPPPHRRKATPVYAPLRRTSWWPGVLGPSAAIVISWGFFLYQGVTDPLGGINSLWPLFGIANQLLAIIALCLGTTVLIKMHGKKYMWITILPMLWLGTVTFTSALMKIFSPLPRIRLLAAAEALEQAPVIVTVPGGANAAVDKTLIFNNYLDAFVCALFLVLVTTILIDSIRQWIGILRGTQPATSTETPFVQSTLAVEEI